jgi:predicted GIY-YIG superfamily endonuclease
VTWWLLCIRAAVPAEGYFVYILYSERAPTRNYSGLTSNVTDRIAVHNAGMSPHTASGPWRIVAAVEFATRTRGGVRAVPEIRSWSRVRAPSALSRLRLTSDIWNGVNSKAARHLPKALWPVVQRTLDQIDAVTKVEGSGATCLSLGSRDIPCHTVSSRQPTPEQ